jgi:hypothetical protein
MKVSIASIIIRNGKAYMPVMGKTDSGLFVNTEPVFICDLFIEEMTQNLQKVKEAGHPYIQILSPEDRKKHSDLMLKATGAKSWKELARTGFSYTIEWSDKGTLIEMSRLDKQGRWEYDLEKARRLPLETPLRDLVQIILEDVKSRLPN